MTYKTKDKTKVKNMFNRSCILLIMACIIISLSGAVVQASSVVVSTNRMTILDDPSGWVYAGWGSQTARGNQVLGEETTIKWYAFVIDQNGTAVSGATVSTNLRFPNNTVYYSTTGITDDNGTVEFVKNLDNLNQRPYFATITEGYWRVDVSATINGQPISSNTRFVYDEIGCGKSGSGCHRSQDWQPTTGASTKSIINGGTFISPSRNSPYVQNRDKIHGTLEGHGHVDLGSNPPISSGECTTCHRSYNGTYTPGSVRQNSEPQYPGGVHQNQVNCTECHGTFATEPDTMVLDMPVKKCYDCHPQINNNLEIMNYIQDPTNSYSYNPLSTSNTIKGHDGGIPCITCHNNGHNITKPYSGSSNAITEYQQCLTCHTTYQNHNGGVDCTVCHSQDAHVIKIFSQNADYVVGKNNPARGNCTNCHEDSVFLNNLEGQPKAGSYSGDVPQIGNQFNHSTGEKWNRSGNLFWNDQLAACKYCHGDTKHDTDGFGKPEGFKGTNTINVSGTWCGSCHYSGNSQYSNMLSAMGLIPPEITGDPIYGNYADGYFDHGGISGFQDSACKGCHGSRPSLTTFMHNAGPGTEGGPDCVSCHNVGSGGDQPHVNVSAMNRVDSIHKDLNSLVGTSLNEDNKRCWACHGNGDEPETHPDNYKTPYNCTDCHTGSNRNFTPSNTIKIVSEHYWSGEQIVTSGVSSCYKCHNRSEMMIVANDPDLGTVYGGVNNGDKSTSHYGKKRTDLVPGTEQYCSYCHNSTIDSFFDVFADVYNTDIQKHSRYGTNPACQNCHDSSSGSRIHDSSLTFSELTLPTSTICLNCHGPGGTATIKDKSKHNGTVECSVCHLGTGKDIHPIKYLNNTGGFDISNFQGVKCDRCHETGRYNAPAIGKVQHSGDTWNGSLWSIGAGRPSEFWDNNSLDTACGYCHGNSKHNASALGRLTTVKGSNNVNVFGTWCGICHYQGNSQFNSMTGIMSIIGIPPEISRHVTYGSYPSGARDGTPYFNHSLNRYNDTRCDDCHYAGTPPNLTMSMHNVVVGGTSCLGCHAADVDITKFGKHANVSKIGSGVTDDDCRGCHFNVLTIGQMIPNYANYSNTYYCQDCHTAGGRNSAQYNNITNVTLRKDGTSHAQANCTMCHIPAGEIYHPNGPKGIASGKNCYSCHYRSDGVGSTPNVANIGQNDDPFYAPGEDHACSTCHDAGPRPTLTGGNGCGHCHGASANNHYVQPGSHSDQVLTLSGVTVDTPVTAGTIANVTGLISNEFVQVAKAQYRITNSAGTLVIRNWAEMNATDGKFNGRGENIKGRIDTTGLSAGIYKVDVKGMISGYWATGGSGHNAALPYYPDNGLWTSTASVTMSVTGSTGPITHQILASGQLYYPGGWYSHFKVGNAGNTANVNVSFYNSAGIRVNTTTTTIARNTSVDYRWQTYAPGVSDGTALINSTGQISAITFQRSDSDGRLGFWEGVPLNPQGTEVFMSGLLYYPGGWRSGFKVLNTESSSTTVNIYFYNTAGAQINSITRTVAAKTSPYYDWYTYGYNITGGATDGTVRIVSTDNKRLHVVASQAMSTVGKLGFWEGISLNSPNTDAFVSGLLYYPGGWRSGFKVANYGTSAASATIYFYNSAGTQINSIPVTIQPKTSPYYDWYTYGYNITGGATDGTARVIVSNSQPIKIVASQADEGQGMLDFYQAPQISGDNTAFVLYQVYDGVERSGFKVANPGTSTISATVRFFNSAGTQINSVTHNIAAKASPYYAWNTYAPGVTSGTATVEANGRIVVVTSIASNQAATLGIFRGVEI
jgi:Cytochrome c7 and related cytochrome c